MSNQEQILRILQNDLLNQVGAKLLVESLEEDHTKDDTNKNNNASKQIQHQPEVKKKPWWKFGK